MKSFAFNAALAWLAWSAAGALAQTPPAPTPATPPAAAAQSEPRVLNPSGGSKAEPAPAPQPYAGQQPPPPPPPAAGAPAPANSAAAPSPAADDKPASPSNVPEGPSVKPIAKPAMPETAPGAAPAPPPPVTAAKPPPPKPTLLVSIDLTNQNLSVTENGTPKYKWHISSGRTGYLTPKGTFRPVWMSKMWYSRKYDYAPMPHAIFFHGGTAIHGTDSLGALGRPASHGCVRLAPSNAAALYALVTRHGKERTRITVFGTPPRSPAMVSAREGDRGAAYPGYRSYRNPPWWNDDDDDYPPPPRRRAYSDRDYDPPSRYYPRTRRYMRDYDPYYDDY